MSVTTEVDPARLSAKTLGVLAVIGLVAAFSLSSTLVKRAETPGVLRQRPRAGGGELDRRRQPVERAADLGRSQRVCASSARLR